MGKKYRISKISRDKCYSIAEIAENQMRHKRTIQSWIRQGLVVLDKNRRPYLVLGEDLIEFLKVKQVSRKVKLKDDECYCVKCRAARKGIPETLKLEYTGKSIGPKAKQVLLRGKCEVCGTPIQRFTSDKKIRSYDGNNMKLKELKQRLWCNNYNSLDNDKKKER